jgi:hypothetical protein
MLRATGFGSWLVDGLPNSESSQQDRADKHERRERRQNIQFQGHVHELPPSLLAMQDNLSDFFWFPSGKHGAARNPMVLSLDSVAVTAFQELGLQRENRLAEIGSVANSC